MIDRARQRPVFLRRHLQSLSFRLLASLFTMTRPRVVRIEARRGIGAYSENGPGTGGGFRYLPSRMNARNLAPAGESNR